MTEYRVRPRADADTQIHLATGSYIDRWRALPGAVKVANNDPTPAPQRSATSSPPPGPC